MIVFVPGGLQLHHDDCAGILPLITPTRARFRLPELLQSMYASREHRCVTA